MDKLILKYAIKNASDFGNAQVGPVVSKILMEKPELKSELKTLMPKIKKAVDDVNKMSVAERKKLLEEFGSEIKEYDDARAKHLKEEAEKGLPELLGDTSKVVMRLAPFPSGPLHIGNARTYILNDEYVKRYNGKLLLVIDDTIGSAEKQIAPEAYDLIPEGLQWLGINFEKSIIYKSDRLDIYYQHAEKLIEKNAAYVCECPVETLRANRAEGKDCKCRSKSVAENLTDWKKMLDSTFKEGEAALRLKTSMQHKNPAFRDRVLFRISETPHPRVGTKYRVWPLLELSWAIDDYVLGITHVMRGKDLMMETEMEQFIWGIFGWVGPQVIHTGLFSVEGVKISKSKSQAEVRSGSYTGWDDPRTWSLQSLRKRGILPEAIRKFTLASRMSQSEVTVPVESLYSENRKLLDPTTNRYFAVFEPVFISLPINKTVEIPLHPEKKETRKITVDGGVYISKSDFDKFKGQEIRLMDLANVKLDEKPTLITDENKSVQKIQWVPKDCFEITIVMPDGTTRKANAEKEVSKLKTGDIIQFVRLGFCRLDKEFHFAH